MRKKTKAGKKILPIVLTLFFGLGIFFVIRAKDDLIRSGVETFLSQILGAKVSMDKFSLSIILGQLDIDGLKVKNPPGFSDEILLELPKITVKFDRAAITLGRLYASYASVYLKRLLLEKDKHGRMNVDSLKVSGAPIPVFRISLLDLQINQVIEKDFRYEKPFVKGHDLNLKKTYKNITNANQLIMLILFEPLKEAGFTGFKILGLSALIGGPAAIPLAVTLENMGKGSVRQEIGMPVNSLYDLSLLVLDELGDIKKQDRQAGLIYADIHGAGVSLTLKEQSAQKTQVVINAKWLFFPEHEIASGVLYEIIKRSEGSFGTAGPDEIKTQNTGTGGG